MALRDHLYAGRMHSSKLDGIQRRQRDVVVLAVGPLAVILDLPRRMERPPAPPVRTNLDDMVG